MTENLLRAEWHKFDTHELRLLLDHHVGGPGQFDGRAENPNKFHLPLAGDSCQITLTFRDKKIALIEPGQAFNRAAWSKIAEDIDGSILRGPEGVGRDYSFSGFRAAGSWRGARSGIQILPPPADAPSAPQEAADHPFIIEFSFQTSDYWPLTNHRRMQWHRRLTLLLNVLLNGGVTYHTNCPRHFWANVPRDDGTQEIRWVQEWYFAKLGEVVLNGLSPPSDNPAEIVEANEYYADGGLDGKPLRVPSDLDDAICRYLNLTPVNRAKFDRAAFWINNASRQWTIAVSSSFASLVSAIEAMVDRGNTHNVYCEPCNRSWPHEVPGAIERFRAFFETYAPGASERKRRTDMYALRSSILHGSDLMQLDQDRHFGWDPPGWNERELQTELWGLTMLAMRKWLKNPPGQNDATSATRG